jgi:hypothetical protein
MTVRKEEGLEQVFEIAQAQAQEEEENERSEE